jgi:RND family efflux transporter MFP subunit
MNTSEKKSLFLKLVLPVLLVLAGVGSVAFFLLTEQPPAKELPRYEGILVETEVVKAESRRPKLIVRGLVTPAREVNLRPEVSGTLIKVSPNLQAGAFFKKDERIAQIDPRPFEYALEGARSRLREAGARLKLELGRSDIAEADWDFFLENSSRTPSEDEKDLALRLPQLNIAQAAVDAAQSAVNRAKLNLEYSSIEAPFDCQVIAESIDPGQFVSPQTLLARLIGSRVFHLQAAVPVDQLSAIAIPGVNAKKGSPVTVLREYEGSEIVRQGTVLHRLGDLEPAGRMARVLIEIEDPFGLETDRTELPLLLNTYATARIETQLTGDWIRVPREAIREGDKVFLYADGELRIQPIEIIWGDPESVLIRSGLEPGDRLVLTNLATPVDGIKLRLSTEKNGNKMMENGKARTRTGEENDG